MVTNPQAEYRRVVDAAVNDLSAHGFDSAERLAYWEEKIRRAAEAAMGPQDKMADLLRDVLRTTYERLVSQTGMLKHHPGVERWTLAKVRPELRAILDRRILASAQLIRIKRKSKIEETLARFAGWATSIPEGGSKETDKRAEKARVKKPLAALPYEERRLLTDQGHKLISSVNETVAEGGGAIAAIWHSRWRQPGYNYREDHKERDLQVYLIPGSWADEKGLVKAGAAGKTSDITKPAEEVFCRCSYVYVYSLRQLEKVAPEMLTEKGREALKAARAAIAGAR